MAVLNAGFGQVRHEERAMTVFFTADLHLGHANIIKYCKRPFMNEEEFALAEKGDGGSWKISSESLQRHDDALIEKINEAAGSKDTLWVLGDFCWAKRNHLQQAQKYRERIKCPDVRLVRGNHDKSAIDSVFTEVIEQGMIEVDDQEIWLNHYPMRSWEHAHAGVWHLYGGRRRGAKKPVAGL